MITEEIPQVIPLSPISLVFSLQKEKKKKIIHTSTAGILEKNKLNDNQMNHKKNKNKKNRSSQSFLCSSAVYYEISVDTITFSVVFLTNYLPSLTLEPKP